ncbi:MAG: hypothetical protein QXD55_00775 [Candidatus Aenigmatarchaeota archaeon]
MPINIFRCSHVPEDLNEKFVKLFKNCDILLLEHAINKDYEIQRKCVSDLAKGNLNYTIFFDSNDIFYGFVEKLLSIIKNSGKQVELERSPVSFKEFEKMVEIRENSMLEFFNGNFTEAYEKRLKFHYEQAKLLRRRDLSLTEQIIELQNKNKDKNILSLIGSDHQIYYYLRKRGVEVKQEFPYKPYVFDCPSELNRRITFNKPFTQDLVAKTFVNNIIGHYLEDLGLPPDRLIEKARKISEKLSYEDIKSLSKYLGEDFLRSKMPEEATVIWLRKKGLEI